MCIFSNDFNEKVLCDFSALSLVNLFAHAHRACAWAGMLRARATVTLCAALGCEADQAPGLLADFRSVRRIIQPLAACVCLIWAID